MASVKHRFDVGFRGDVASGHRVCRRSNASDRLPHFRHRRSLMPQMTMVQAIQDALRTALREDPRVVVLGEDVGKNGGVFRVTEGLQAEFGEQRVTDTPLAENGIVGAAIGMAIYGMRPIVEIQFIDFVYSAFDQIVSELSKMRWRSAGQYACPVIIRAPYGGGIRGGLYHSQ